MKMKNILNEWKKFTIQEAKNDGLYQAMRVQPGSLDIFLRHFVEDNPHADNKIRSWIESNYKDQIEAVREEDIPPTDLRGHRDRLTKVKNALYGGQSYWWATIFPGYDAARDLVNYKTELYYDDLRAAIEGLQYNGKGYREVTSEEFEAMPEEQRNVSYEKHFWEDYLESFFNNFIGGTQATNTMDYVGAKGVQTGLFGQLKDWWMGGEGMPVWKGSFRRERDALYQEFRRPQDPEEGRQEVIPSKESPFKK